MTPRRKNEPSTKSKDSHANGALTPSFPRTRHTRRKSCQRVQKPENPRRASARLRARSLDTPSSAGLPQKPSNRCEEQVGTRQRKRRRDSEEEPQLCSEKARPAKRVRNRTSGVSDKPQPLNAEALETHTTREGYVDVLGLMGDNIQRNRGSKRSASKVGMRNGSTASTGTGDQDTASQVTHKSSYTAAHYRLSILADANIIFRFLPAPEDVRTRITAIVQRPVSKERKEELSRIAHTLHNKFAPVLSAASREDDCIELFHEALSALGYSESLLLPRKAGMVSQPSTPSNTFHAHFIARLGTKPQAAHAPSNVEPRFPVSVTG